MSFDNDEYLSEDIQNHIANTKDKYKEMIEILNEANRLSYEMRYKFNIPKNNPKLIAIGVLYIKIIQSFQVSVILYEYGLKSDVKSISRILLESTMKFILNRVHNQ